MLRMNPDWHFDSPGPIEPGVISTFLNFIARMAGQDSSKQVLELFKRRFAAAADVPYFPSSNLSWAQTDLERVMNAAADNAPLFISSFVAGCEELRQMNIGLPVPDVGRVNRALNEGGAAYQIRGDELIATRTPIVVDVPSKSPSLDQQAQAIIEDSLVKADRALIDGNGRQAVQELLWLLETLSTAFRGLPASTGTVQGKYFNKIVAELRAGQRGTHQEQIFNWMVALHGFLSTPTGGGIRHGLDLVDGDPVLIDEARLYCNLIRSYISYLMAAHARLKSA